MKEEKKGKNKHCYQDEVNDHLIVQKDQVLQIQNEVQL